MSESLNSLYQKFTSGQISAEEYQERKKQLTENTPVFPTSPKNASTSSIKTTADSNPPQPTAQSNPAAGKPPVENINPMPSPATQTTPQSPKTIPQALHQTPTASYPPPSPVLNQPLMSYSNTAEETDYETPAPAPTLTIVDEQEEKEIKKFKRKLSQISVVSATNFMLILVLGFVTFTGAGVAFNTNNEDSTTTTTTSGFFDEREIEESEVELYVPPEPTVLEFDEFETTNLIDPPAEFNAIMQEAYQSIFEVRCTYIPGTAYVGAGWAVTLNTPEDTTETLIVTNHHVIEECLTSGEITVSNDTHGTIEAEIYTAEGGYWEVRETGSSDSLRDLSALQLKTTKTIAGFPIQEEPASLGQWVAAVGYPSTEEEISARTTTTGTISEFEQISRMILTTAEVRPGNSGGPLLNNRGEVVGTIFANSSEKEGVGYAQPLQYACTIVFECLDGRLTYGENELVDIYAPLTPGDCLGYSLGGQFNLYNVSCDSFNTTYQITAEIDNPETYQCETGAIIEETVAGRLKTYCASTFE